jgi:CRISPR-associated protein Csx1
MSSDETLLIAVWGNPESWATVERYVVELPENQEWLAEKPYRSTLGPLMEAYSHPTTLLYAPSTLEKPTSDKDYEQIRGEVRRYIESKIGDEHYCPTPSRVEIAVAPSIGSFGKGQETYSSRGLIELYSSHTHIATYNKLMREKPTKIILDLSHGVNYMPTYLRQTTETAIASYILATGKTVKLLVYNSAPVPGGDRGRRIEESTIHLVEEKEINGWDAKRILYTQLGLQLLKPTHQASPIRSPLGLKVPEHDGREWRRLLEAIKYFVKSAELGQSLPLAYIIGEINGIDIQRLYRTAERFAYIRDCSDLVEIGDRTIIFRYALRYGASLSITLANSIKSKDWQGTPPYPIDHIKMISKNYMTLATDRLLESEARQLEDRVGIVQKLLPHHRIDKTLYVKLIEVGNIQIGKGRRLLDIYREQHNVDEKAVEEAEEIMRRADKQECPDPRNLIAHAGLEQNITLITLREGRILVEYREDIRSRLKDLIQSL